MGRFVLCFKQELNSNDLLYSTDSSSPVNYSPIEKSHILQTKPIHLKESHYYHEGGLLTCIGATDKLSLFIHICSTICWHLCAKRVPSSKGKWTNAPQTKSSCAQSVIRRIKIELIWFLPCSPVTGPFLAFSSCAKQWLAFSPLFSLPTACILVTSSPFIGMCFYETYTGLSFPPTPDAMIIWFMLFPCALDPWLNFITQKYVLFKRHLAPQIHSTPGMSKECALKRELLLN